MQKQSLLERALGKEILIVGDLILDQYLHGRVDRISPEAPVPVVLHEEEEYRLGGAANVALNVQALGAQAHVLSMLGEDRAGNQICQLLEEAGISSAGILRNASIQSSLKTRVLARGQQLLRYDRERIVVLSQEQEDQLFARCARFIEERDISVLVFQDYNKGVLSPKLIERIIALCAEAGIASVVDPKKEQFFAYEGVTLFKPNLKELNEALGLSLSEKQISIEALEQACASLQARLGNSYSLITLGAKGMYLYGQGLSYYQPTRERQVADVCGAGDTVVSIAALGLAASWDLRDLISMANLGGGQVCERMGVVQVEPKQLEEEFVQWQFEQKM